MVAYRPLMIARADAGPDIGGGHVMRCLALAQAWQRRGGRTLFVSKCLPETLRDRLKREGCEAHILEVADVSEDAVRLIDIARRASADWLVIDGYPFTPDYRQRLASPSWRRLWISDDCSPVTANADLILNPHLFGDARAFAPAHPEECLIGPIYALLRDEFGQTPKRPAAIERKQVRIVLTVGQADPRNLLELALRALRKLVFEIDSCVDVLVPAFGTLGPVAQSLQNDPRFVWHSQVESLAPLFHRADLAIAAAGSTSYELAACGVPMLLVAIAENQLPLGLALDAHGAAVFLGPQSGLTEATLIRRSGALLRDRGHRRRLGKAGRQLVDGNGARRVVDRMLADCLDMRPVTLRDAAILYDWQSDPLVRRQSFSDGPASFASHLSWLTQKLSTAGCDSPLWIGAFSDRTPVGMVRFDQTETESVVSLLVDPHFRGRGLSRILLRNGIKEHRRGPIDGPLTAYIRPTNAASYQTFAACGFALDAQVLIRGEPAERWILPPEALRCDANSPYEHRHDAAWAGDHAA